MILRSQEQICKSYSHRRQSVRELLSSSDYKKMEFERSLSAWNWEIFENLQIYTKLKAHTTENFNNSTDNTHKQFGDLDEFLIKMLIVCILKKLESPIQNARSFSSRKWLLSTSTKVDQMCQKGISKKETPKYDVSSPRKLEEL